MNRNNERSQCPDCAKSAPIESRRRFLLGAGATVAAAGVGGPLMRRALAAVEPIAKGAKVAEAETTVKRLFASLTAEQKAACVMPFDHPKATQVSANWAIIEPTIGKLYNEEQQRMIHEILRGVTSEDGYERMIRQMSDDNGGFENYHCALFGDPNGKLEWVMSGRHLTIRCDGNSMENSAFGGPITYGHGLEGEYKKNLFHFQTEAVNKLFNALDGKQREKALLDKAPAENNIQIKKDGFAGLPLSELTEDQQKLAHQVGVALLGPYRESDVAEAMKSLEDNGGPEMLHLSYYKNDDLGNDGEWDIWRYEGPTLVWHFRGAPHVHAWVNWKTKA
jgi:hypothetical protein